MFTRSTKAALAASLFAAIAVLNVPPAQAQEAGEVSVTFSGMRAVQGALFVGVYDNEAAFAGGQPVDGFRLAVDSDTVGKSIKGLKPGRYAIKVYHDVDGDGRMNTNAFGIPTEPYAASNNAPSTMGPPNWSDAAFEVTADGAVQSIVIN